MAEQRIADYVKIGEGPITIFLLHGGYGAKEYFRYEAAALAHQGYRVVAWDAPGYGISPLPKPYSIELLAEAAARLVREVGGERNVVLGQSMGGIIVPKLCDIIPDRIEAVVISATLADLKQGGEEFEKDFLEKRVPPLRKVKTLAEAAMPLLKSMLAPSSHGPMVDLVLQVAGETPTETFIEAMLAISRYKGEPVVRRLRKPTLCVAGRHDPVGKWELVKELSEMIAGAEYAVFDQSGHYPFAEAHEDFNRTLLDFLKRNGL